jgi:hypothetical protein
LDAQPDDADPEGDIKCVQELVFLVNPRATAGDNKKIGVIAANRYRAIYGKEPEKHTQQIGGRPCKVMHYGRKAHAMVVQVARDYFAGGEEE